jgi:hypothetical protein
MSMVIDDSSCVLGCGCGALVLLCLRFRNLSSVDWVCMVGMGGEFLCDMEHGVGKTMLMRCYACAAELRLMGVGSVLE